MYRVLIADDETLDLEGMRMFIPWEELGFHVVAAVNNGYSACEVLEQHKIDVLVTDVRMPNMTGLQLAKRAQEMDNHIRFIFVSGYQDFGYVKQAMSLNAYSYVLKPMDDSELIEALLRVKNELDLERQQAETERAYRQIAPIAKNEFVLQLLEGTPQERFPELLLHHYGMNSMKWPIRGAILEIDDEAWKRGHVTELQKQERLSGFLDRLAPIFEQHRIRHFCKASVQRIAFLLESDTDKPQLEHMIQHVKNQLSLSITIGLGGQTTAMPTLHESYAQAISALEYKMILGKGKIIEADHAVTMNDHIRSIDIHLDPLINAMVHGDRMRISDETEQLIRFAAELKSRFHIQTFMMKVMLMIESHLKKYNQSLFAVPGRTANDLEIMMRFETLGEIRSWFTACAIEISELLRSKEQNKNAKLVREMIAYMRNQLHGNLTLKEVADHFLFSPNYLGVIFKEETSSTFSEYMIKLRMETAGEMLKDPKLKIYEVADKVGYRYMPYFSRQFKETYGMTPAQFRRQL